MTLKDYAKLLVAFGFLALAGCAGDTDTKEVQDEQPVEILYNRAADAMAAEDYKERRDFSKKSSASTLISHGRRRPNLWPPTPITAI